MKRIVQIGQTRSVYMIECEDYEAFALQNNNVTVGVLLEAADPINASSFTR
jgi:hypothetical protein